jgi:protein Tex
MLPSIQARLATELSAHANQVAAAVALLDEGATVPFIARYRKEATGGLDDIQLRLLEERLRYLRELEERRAAIVESINTQGKMTDALALAIAKAEDKTTLEDLYQGDDCARGRLGAAGRCVVGRPDAHTGDRSR